MDFSYVEEESIHIIAPYSSEPRWALYQTSESIDEGEHQVSRSFESNQIDESELHHRFVPSWRIIPSKSHSKLSRPMTSIVSVPLKKHSIDESFLEDQEDFDHRLSLVSKNYGRTGIILFKNYQIESNLENKVIEEYLKLPHEFAVIAEECKEFIANEKNMLNKIIIDLAVEYWKNLDLWKLREWVEIAKQFYLGSDRMIFTNFELDGILHFENKEEYLEYYRRVLRD